jgi:putative FmdB family regulatory protein
MPTYEYRCQDCRHELEAQQAFSDDPLTECPSCGGLLKKKFSAVGISFKGSGFYKTDSRSSPSKAKSDANGSGSSESSSSDTSPSTESAKAPAPDSGSSKTESKSESKAPASTPA